jgi:hypothetical protein
MSHDPRPTLTIPEAIQELVRALQARRETAQSEIAKRGSELQRLDATLVHLGRALNAAKGTPPPKRTYTRRKGVVREPASVAVESTNGQVSHES